LLATPRQRAGGQLRRIQIDHHQGTGLSSVNGLAGMRRERIARS
jgi:hypothetical protein